MPATRIHNRADGERTWAFTTVRINPRDRRHRLSNDKRERGVNCTLCQFGKLYGLEGSEPGNDFEIVPTLTASGARATDEPGILPLESLGTETDAGVTVRYGITPDMTANLAINPDFSQVEADAAQLDINNRFALFFPEKRPFFLEGKDYFTTPMQAVFTRTVVSPDVGAKLTGKRGRHTVGSFIARDEITGLLFPGSTESLVSMVSGASMTVMLFLHSSCARIPSIRMKSRLNSTSRLEFFPETR